MSKSSIKQNVTFDKSMHGFIPKDKGEVDLVGKLFIRKASQHGHKDVQDIGEGTLLCGVAFGLDWNGQGEDEMWECEINIKPVRKHIDKTSKKGFGKFAPLRIDQVLASGWGDSSNYTEIKF